MVYANFSSNLPTGLQHFKFVDLTTMFCVVMFSGLQAYPVYKIGKIVQKWGKYNFDLDRPHISASVSPFRKNYERCTGVKTAGLLEQMQTQGRK